MKPEGSLLCSQKVQVLILSHFGGVVVSVLATRFKGRGFVTGQGDGFLKAIKSAAHLPSDRK
jgi:nitrogenase molybdenum-iron protein alpha/beta subunit